MVRAMGWRARLDYRSFPLTPALSLGERTPRHLMHFAPLNRTGGVVGRASRLPHRASRPRWKSRGRDALMADETPAPLFGGSGAGSHAFRHSPSLSARDCSPRGRRFSLSLGERAEVRGKGMFALRALSGLALAPDHRPQGYKTWNRFSLQASGCAGGRCFYPRHRRSRRALPITTRSDKPIAAAHKIGLMNPRAASGTPMAL